ncbi:MAG: DUF1993 domain-containing protein [Pontixanthobacter sp.]
MPITLHDAIVPTRLRTIAAMRTLVDRAERWCTEKGEPASAIIDASLADDMWAFGWQINSVWMHSAHALDAAMRGTFEPNFSDIPADFDACRAKLDRARDGCAACDADKLEARCDANIDFVMGGKTRMSFTGQDFLIGFSNPNFFFHATTAYDILRMKGLDIGKRDYLGALPIKG